MAEKKEDNTYSSSCCEIVTSLEKGGREAWGEEEEGGGGKSVPILTIQEDEAGVTCQLDTNSETLTFLTGQSRTRGSYDLITGLLQL